MVVNSIKCRVDNNIASTGQGQRVDVSFCSQSSVLCMGTEQLLLPDCSSSSVTSESEISLPVLEQMALPAQTEDKSFLSDSDDSYHLLSHLLQPVKLSVDDVPPPSGSHPAVCKWSGPGLFSQAQVLASAGPQREPGPCYDPFEVVRLATHVESFGCPNFEGARVEVRSHLNVPALEFLLTDYDDKWVVRGSKYGWPLSRDKNWPLSGKIWPNHGSALRNLDKVKTFIDNEVKLGAVYCLGHVPVELPPPLSTIPLLTVPKAPDPGAVRVCGDCSYPPGMSLNDGVQLNEYCGEPYRCKLPTIWDFIHSILEIGVEDVVVAKLDQSRGYRQIPIDPGDWSKQIFHLPDCGFLLDMRGIFGARLCGYFMQRENQGLGWATMATSVVVDEDEISKSTNVDKSENRSVTTYIDDSLTATHRACARSVW